MEKKIVTGICVETSTALSHHAYSQRCVPQRFLTFGLPWGLPLILQWWSLKSLYSGSFPPPTLSKNLREDIGVLQRQASWSMALQQWPSQNSIRRQPPKLKQSTQVWKRPADLSCTHTHTHAHALQHTIRTRNITGRKKCFCIYLISCNALHDRKNIPRFLFPLSFSLSGWKPGRSPENTNYMTWKNILRIYFLSGLGLHDRKKKVWEFIWK